MKIKHIDGWRHWDSNPTEPQDERYIRIHSAMGACPNEPITFIYQRVNLDGYQ